MMTIDKIDQIFDIKSMRFFFSFQDIMLQLFKGRSLKDKICQKEFLEIKVCISRHVIINIDILMHAIFTFQNICIKFLMHFF